MSMFNIGETVDFDHFGQIYSGRIVGLYKGSYCIDCARIPDKVWRTDEELKVHNEQQNLLEEIDKLCEDSARDQLQKDVERLFGMDAGSGDDQTVIRMYPETIEVPLITDEIFEEAYPETEPVNTVYDTKEVDHPPHYNQGEIECIDAIREMLGDRFKDYCLGNVVKYIWRHDYKGKAIQDLRKAEWYLKRAIEAVEGQQNDSNLG